MRAEYHPGSDERGLEAGCGARSGRSRQRFELLCNSRCGTERNRSGPVKMATLGYINLSLVMMVFPLTYRILIAGWTYFVRPKLPAYKKAMPLLIDEVRIALLTIKRTADKLEALWAAPARHRKEDQTKRAEISSSVYIAYRQRSPGELTPNSRKLDLFDAN